MNSKYTIWLFVTAVMILPVIVFSIVNSYEKKYESLPVLYDNTNRITSISLTNQHRELITEKNFNDKILIVDFFFTHCPAVCPKMTNNLKYVQDALNSDTSVVINSITIDPERDSAGRLNEYAKKFRVGANWNFLTGDKQQIYRIARKGYYITASEGDGGPGDFIHSDRIVLVDKHGRIRAYYEGTDQKAMLQLIKDIQKLKEED
jgi:protein SCO1/2